MTGDEMERAIEFLIQNQAKFDALLERNAKQIAETDRQLQLTAETLSEFIRIVTNTIQALNESQSRMDERLTRNDERLGERLAQNDERFNERIAELDRKFTERTAQTDERLNRLAELVERHIREGRDASP